MKLIIDRARWLRGTGNDSKLLDPMTQKMCCLGFYATACGLKDEDINNHSMPSCIAGNKIPDTMKWLIGSSQYLDSDAANKLARINDRISISEDDREGTIINLFEKHDVQVEFIN